MKISVSFGAHTTWQPSQRELFSWLGYNKIMLLNLNAIIIDSLHCVGANVYQQCRLSIPFVSLECPVGSIVNIKAARAEFRGTRPCQSTANASCTRSIIDHSAIVSCNGQHSCRLSSDILDYPQHDWLCNQSQHGNFIWIEYNCTESKEHI